MSAAEKPPPGEGLYRKLVSEAAEVRAKEEEARTLLYDLGLNLTKDVTLEYAPFPGRYRVLDTTRKQLLFEGSKEELVQWCREDEGGVWVRERRRS